MIRTREQVLTIMKEAYESSKYVLVGEQLIGSNDFPDDMFKRYRDSSDGMMPAILGLDLGIYGMDLLRCGEEKWKKHHDQTVAFAEMGGIVTASHHWDNPSVDNPADVGYCRGMFGDGTAKYWEELITEGSEINKKFKNDLLTAGRFLKELDDLGIPVLYRPLHESNGCWFWFTAKSSGSQYWTDGDYLKRLWRYIYDLYVNRLGMKNLIWVYSPNNGGDGKWVQNVLYYYPGDDVVDMVGLDWYTGGKKEIYDKNHSYDLLMSIGKPVAICEFGPGGDIQMREKGGVEAQEKVYNCLNYLSDLTSLTNRGMKCAYVLTWHKGYGAFSSMGKAKEALASPFFCTLDRLNEKY